MKAHRMADRLLLMAMFLLLSLVLISCCKREAGIVLPESRVQKISAGESASFDGYVFTTGAAAKLLESAERCKAIK